VTVGGGLRCWSSSLLDLKANASGSSFSRALAFQMNADDSQKEVTTRSNLHDARELVKVGDDIGRLQKQLNEMQNSQNSLASNLSADLVSRRATFEDKIAAQKFLESNAEATQRSVCKLLANGEFPGLENQIVLLKPNQFSKFISAGKKACGSAWRPPVLSGTVNADQSVTFAYDLIRVTIPQIAYKRNLLPYKCFETSQFLCDDILMLRVICLNQVNSMGTK